MDLDFEHLTPYSTIPGDDEFAYYATLVKTLKNELETVVKPQWVSKANAAGAALQAAYSALQPWQQADMKDYYLTNIQYCKELAKNGAPQLDDAVQRVPAGGQLVELPDAGQLAPECDVRDGP